MQTEVINLKSNRNRLLLADEKFWSNIKYMIFHTGHLQVKLKRGRSTNYLHYWAFENINDPSQSYTEQEKQEIYKEHGCTYRFSKKDNELVSYLYDEADKRKLIKHPYEEEVFSPTIHRKATEFLSQIK